MARMGPLNQKINSMEQRKNEYLQQARQDVAARKAMHNSQLQAYDQEIKPLKRQAWKKSLSENFAKIGQNVGKMGPQ